MRISTWMMVCLFTSCVTTQGISATGTEQVGIPLDWIKNLEVPIANDKGHPSEEVIHLLGLNSQKAEALKDLWQQLPVQLTRDLVRRSTVLSDEPGSLSIRVTPADYLTFNLLAEFSNRTMELAQERMPVVLELKKFKDRSPSWPLTGQGDRIIAELLDPSLDFLFAYQRDIIAVEIAIFTSADNHWQMSMKHFKTMHSPCAETTISAGILGPAHYLIYDYMLDHARSVGVQDVSWDH